MPAGAVRYDPSTTQQPGAMPSRTKTSVESGGKAVF